MTNETLNILSPASIGENRFDDAVEFLSIEIEAIVLGQDLQKLTQR